VQRVVALFCLRHDVPEQKRVTVIINQKSVRNLDRFLGHVPFQSELEIGLPQPEGHLSRLQDIGFDDPILVNTSVLPAKVGPVSRYNAEGKFIVHRDLPKEDCVRPVYWEWMERHGDVQVPMQKVCYVHYKRYPRTFMPPPSIEICASDFQGRLKISAPTINWCEENRTALAQSINLFLEIFGQCEIRQEGKLLRVVPEVTHLNWKILPEGEHPWPGRADSVTEVIKGLGPRSRKIFRETAETLVAWSPDRVYVGQAGFYGYLVFEYARYGVFVLESPYYGNATYVLGGDWEHLSQMSKATILQSNSHISRVIHTEGWAESMGRLFLAQAA
jgi:hypothetical protein